MGTLLSLILLVVVIAVAIAAMLAVRRRAPEGSFFEDGDRAAGVFGVLATGFSVLLGLIVVIAFTSFDDSRKGAEEEALAVTQQFETAQFLPDAVRRRLGDELVCYGRFVVHREFPDQEDGRLSEAINPWSVALFRTLKTARPASPTEQSAYDKWLDQTADREQAANDRKHGAEGVIPGALWVVLFVIAAIILGFVLFFADSGERPVVQAMLMGSLVAVIGVTLLLIRNLDNPFQASFGGLEPVAMERTLRTLDRERRIVGDSSALPCSARGTVPAR
jgi:Protein of unknown function (DUF4239)